MTTQEVGDPILPIGQAGNSDFWEEQCQQLFSLEGQSANKHFPCISRAILGSKSRRDRHIQHKPIPLFLSGFLGSRTNVLKKI